MRAMRKTSVAAAVALACRLAYAENSGSQDIVVNIESQRMDRALNALAQQAGLQVLFRAQSSIEGVKAPRVVGTFSTREALEKLLAGTSLDYEFVGERTVAIQVKEPVGAVGRGVDERMRLAQVPAPAEESQVEEVVVTSKVFVQNDAFGATKMGLSLKDTPQTVVVVTKDLIEASGMRSFNDFYKVDASGGTSHNVVDKPTNYYRGFFQVGPNAIRVDGFRSPGNNVDLDFAVFDRFEVIKGPTSTLYGQSSIAGTLNAVSKLPQRQLGGQLSLEAGEFNQYRVDADVTGPLAGSDVWSYRLIGAYADADSFLDFAYNKLKLLSSSVAYQPSEATTLILRATVQESDLRHHFASVLQLAGDGTGSALDRALSEGFKIPDVSRSRFFGMPWNHANIDAHFIQFQGDHTFANGWQLRAHAQYNRSEHLKNTFSAQAPYDENGFAYSTYAYGSDIESDLYGAEVNLFGTVRLFGRDHTLYIGADYDQTSLVGPFGFQSLSSGFEGSLFNMFDSDYSAVPRFGTNDYAYLYASDQESESYGATVQLILNPTDRLKLLLGGRYSVDTMLNRRRELSPVPSDNFETELNREFRNQTVQTGATYKLTDELSLYASYGTTYEPETALVFTGDGSPGRVIDPEEGENYEIGAKADWSKNLSFSLAAFQMERTNISQRDPAHPGFRLPLGTQRSRGVELGAQGRLAPPLNIFVSMAYLDAEFSAGEFRGLQPANAPRFGVSVFGSYEILTGGWQGLGFGLGVVHKSGLKGFDSGWTRAAGVPVTFDFGSFTEVDARVFYSRGPWGVALSATNLFDEKYYSLLTNSLRIGSHVNPPRTIQATVRYVFGSSGFGVGKK